MLERFFDEVGGMQLVIHSPYGSRINRAWGLALRKRFCRKFNFELQAAATEDNIVLSLTTAHSFELAEVARYLHSATIRPLLIQALLDAPMFITRWRWVIGVALALPRFRGGRKVAPQLARMGAEDLIGAVFPDQIACAENLVGEREIPDHPLVRQTITDCLSEAMDLDGLERLLRRIESGDIRIVARDLTEPSPLALEVLSARPYAYLDDAPLEERRTQAVMSRRWLSPETASDLGRLDPDAIARVRAEAWPDAANADELHDALVWLGFHHRRGSAARATAGATGCAELARQKRVARLDAPAATLWIAAERLPQFAGALAGGASSSPRSRAPVPTPNGAGSATRRWSKFCAAASRAWGRSTRMRLRLRSDLRRTAIAAALAALEAEGFAMRGRFTPRPPPRNGASAGCSRAFTAIPSSACGRRSSRSRRATSCASCSLGSASCRMRAWRGRTRSTPSSASSKASRRRPAPGKPKSFLRVSPVTSRPGSTIGAWRDRSRGHACGRGQAGRATGAPMAEKAVPHRCARHRSRWSRAVAPRSGRRCPRDADTVQPSSRAQAVADHIRQHGASFFDELVEGTGLLRSQVEEALAELVALGIVSSDSFGGLRALLLPSGERRPIPGGRRRRRTAKFGMEAAGRWALVRRPPPAPPADRSIAQEAIEHVARTLLTRYGVVFWRLLEREAAWLPPWRDLLRVYRRLESRGEIRGGRFVAGFSGEQFALPDAVGMLRDVRRQSNSGVLVSLSGADPLNLVGILTPGPKLAALTGNRLLYRDGVPVALLAAGDVQFLETLDAASEWEAHKALLRCADRYPQTPPTWAGAAAMVARSRSGMRRDDIDEARRNWRSVGRSAQSSPITSDRSPSPPGSSSSRPPSTQTAVRRSDRHCRRPRVQAAAAAGGWLRDRPGSPGSMPSRNCAATAPRSRRWRPAQAVPAGTRCCFPHGRRNSAYGHRASAGRSARREP